MTWPLFLLAGFAIFFLFLPASCVEATGIEVTFHNGRRFAVTVDDAATGAALLNGLVTRLSPED